MRLHLFALLTGGLLAMASVAVAQSFGGNVSDAVPEVPSVPTSVEAFPPTTPPQRVSNMPGARSDVFVPKGAYSVLNQPTEDGSKRGGVAVRTLDRYGRPVPAKNIFMYYDNFQISQSMAGMVTCDVRIFVNNNLDSRLVSLDVKLVWPGLTTTVSFQDINPNSPSYYNYTLMGEGCYTMDKMPNIVVNRCRVKGLSSSECASRIVWLKATN